jgi:hypothetical protein
MVYRECTIEQRSDINYIPSLKKWGYRLPDIHSPDCPACLHGRIHSDIEHEQALKRNYEASCA